MFAFKGSLGFIRNLVLNTFASIVATIPVYLIVFTVFLVAFLAKQLNTNDLVLHYWYYRVNSPFTNYFRF